MPDPIVHELALDPHAEFRDVDRAQWANLELLLKDAAPGDLAVAVRTFVSEGSSAVIGQANPRQYPPFPARPRKRAGTWRSPPTRR